MQNIQIEELDKFSPEIRKIWQQDLKALPRSNLFQDPDFAEAISTAGKSNYRLYIIKENQKILAKFVIFETTYFGFIKHRKIIRGPVFKAPPMPSELSSILNLIKRTGRLRNFEITTLQPELPDTEAMRKTLAGANLSRIQTGYESIWIDLSLSIDSLRKNLDGKWRNQLSKSEKSDLAFKLDAQEAADWLLEHQSEFQRQKRYQSIDTNIYLGLPEHKKSLYAVYNGETIIGAALFALHGKCATYAVGYVSPEGRNLNANNYLMWQSLISLKMRGIDALDIGGIGSYATPEITRFKSRMGGAPFTLVGTYL
ncbi:MAG: GNAT family N-acetyltransferase [Alphaproteobacteria bacterium]|nr:GNAT family N-acetyltransferase [Alphaproteobacteria bacterium]